MEILPQILYFVLFTGFGAILPGILLTMLFMKRLGKTPAPEALCAVSLLAGLLFQISLWAALRRAGLSYGTVAASHAVILLALALFALRGAEGRGVFYGLLRSLFSAEAGLFLALAVPLAAYLSYNQVDLYHLDELFRMTLAFSAQESMPAQNPLVWTGILKYHYAMEFFAASAAAVTKVPLETIYFRFMLPFNWMLLFFGMRGLLAQYKPGFRRYAPHAAFLLFFLWHMRVLLQFAYRQNTFALGLSVLAISSMCTALGSGALFPLLACAAAVGLITLVKAPFGALYLLFFYSALAAGAWAGLLTRRRAAAAALAGLAGWVFAYGSLSGGGFHGAGALFRIGVGPEYAREFIPEYLADKNLLAALSAAPAAGARLLARLLMLAESVMTVAIMWVIPATAAVLCFCRLRRAENNILRLPAGATLASAFAALLAGAGLFCFVHYKISPESDVYWLFFSVWMFAGAAYPFLIEELRGLLTPRRAALLALVPLFDLAAWLCHKAGWTAFLDGKTLALCVPAGILLVFFSARFVFYYGADKTNGRAAERARGAAWLALLFGGLLSFLLRYGIDTGQYKELFFLSTWLLAAAAYPLLLAEFRPAGLAGGLFLFCAVPFLAALAQAPKYVYWASQAKVIIQEQWTGDNMRACTFFNSRGGSNKLYIHNLLDRSSFTLAAMCRGRMYASYSSGNSVWEDTAAYAAAKAETVRFFTGKAEDPCAWLESRGIGYVYWDKTGSPYKFPALVGSMKFISKIYEGGNAAVYEARPCEKAPAGDQREGGRKSK